MNKIKILVTGGAGFIGGNLVLKLLSNERNIVTNIDKLSYASNLNFLDNLAEEYKHKPDRYYFIKCDLTNKKQLTNAIKNSDPDIIFHLAAESHVDRSIKTPNIFIENNIIGTYNLLDESYKHWSRLSGSRRENFRLIHISTDEVFGSIDRPYTFDEKSNYDPNSPYSASKASSDHLVNAWFKTYKLPIIITHCTNNYGPNQFPEKLIPVIIKQALANKKIPIYGSGENIREWLYVDDHVSALIAVASNGKIGERYCIGSGYESSNLKICKIICEILEEIKPQHEHPYKNQICLVDDRPGHDFRYALDSSKIKNELCWKPKFTLKEGLTKTIYWYLNNLVFLNKQN